MKEIERGNAMMLSARGNALPPVLHEGTTKRGYTFDIRQSIYDPMGEMLLVCAKRQDNPRFMQTVEVLTVDDARAWLRSLP